MKKAIGILALMLTVPLATHAQRSGSNTLSAPVAGGAGGAAVGGLAPIPPSIPRGHVGNFITVYTNPGEFKPSVYLPWDEAVALGRTVKQ